MSQLTALSVSIAVLGGIWAFLALGPLSGLVLVWAGFIAWGCYFHSGGDDAALKKTIAGNIYGAFIAWIALNIIVMEAMQSMGTVGAALVVGITVFFLVIVAGCQLLSGKRLWLRRHSGLFSASTHNCGGRTLAQPDVCQHGQSAYSS
jgi:hypothetical protein